MGGLQPLCPPALVGGDDSLVLGRPIPGGAAYELRYVASDAEIARVLRFMREAPMFADVSGGTMRDYYLGPSGNESARFNEQVAVEARATHGESYGIAVNTKRNVVLYRANAW